MKKVVSLLLTIALAFTMFGCSKSDTESGEKIKHDVNVKKYASSGQIPEIEFILGDSIAQLKDTVFEEKAGMTYDEFCKKVAESGEVVQQDMYSAYDIYTTVGSDGHSVVETANEEAHNTVYYFYTTGKEDAKISAIAVPGELEAFGFTGGNVKSYITAVVGSEYEKAKFKNNFIFMPREDEGATGIAYTFGDYLLEFYFSEQDDLIMTVLYDTNLW